MSVDQRRMLFLEPFLSSREGQDVLGLQLRDTTGMGIGKRTPWSLSLGFEVLSALGMGSQ